MNHPKHALARYFWCLTTLAWLIGCREAILPTVKPPAASLVFEKFCPVDQFRQLGYQVKSFRADARISPKEIYAWRAFYGTIALPDGVGGCDSVCTGIHQCLEAAMDDGTVEEAKSDPHRDHGAPLLETYRYTLAGRRGIVYVWLYPNDSETELNFAILLQETFTAPSS